MLLSFSLVQQPFIEGLLGGEVPWAKGQRGRGEYSISPVAFHELAPLFMLTECHSGHYVLTIENLEWFKAVLKGLQ